VEKRKKLGTKGGRKRKIFVDDLRRKSSGKIAYQCIPRVRVDPEQVWDLESPGGAELKDFSVGRLKRRRSEGVKGTLRKHSLPNRI